MEILYSKTGYAAIDSLNPELFKIVNSFFEKCSLGRGTEMLDEAFLILGNYIINHFPEEESLMIKYDYPDYSYHKIQHDTFCKLTFQLKDEFQREGGNNKLLAKLNSFFIYWLYHHIKQSDYIMTTYFDSCKELPLDNY